MQKKIVVFYALLIFLYMLLILRVYYLGFSSDLTKSANTQSSYVVDICQTRGAIFDCNLQRFTEQEFEYVAIVSPCPEAIQAIAKEISGNKRTEILELAREGKPFICSIGLKPIYAEGIFCTKRYFRYPSQSTASHILGYLDYDGVGISGLEAAFEDELSAAGEKASVKFSVDIKNQVLNSDEMQIQGATNPVNSGIVLTLDKEIQLITQTVAGQMLQKGAVVVMDIDNGNLKAVASVPSFSPNSLAEDLQDENLPFLNRAFCAYNVGSTFKLAVAAAALENGIGSDFSVDCVGGLPVNGRMVYCHHRAGHRETNMKRALEQSCNPYFIRLGQEIGGKNILTMAKNMGFGEESFFAETLISAKGNLPESVDSELALANLSFGQGELLATPVQIAQMISSIANGGYRVSPQLICGWTENIKQIQQNFTAKQRIMSEDTAKTLQKFMVDVVENGSGTNAKPENFNAGGKTASAQTGIFDENGNEIVHAWFAGFFPADEPKYAVVVFAEGMESGGTYAAPVFKRIADCIYEMEKDRN